MENPENIPETLAEMGVSRDVEAFFQLFRYPYRDRVLDNLDRLSLLSRSVQNVTIAVERASTVVSAMKTMLGTIGAPILLKVSIPYYRFTIASSNKG